ncbi:MAG: hypothetical protein ABSG86_21840 [Thermoguttaceae bacterium]
MRLVLLCEDVQQETFARRFLKRAITQVEILRVERAPGKGAAEQFVRERFPPELRAHRSSRIPLVVLIDGDKRGVLHRLAALDQACRSADVPPRRDGDRVLIAVPTWNIETWLAYLNGAAVDEGKKDYPRLDRPRDCQRHVDCLYDMCRQRALRQPSPPSLDAACDEYRSRLKQ